MDTIKDFFNALPKAIIESIDNGEFLEPQDMQLAFSASGNVYDSGLSALTINNYGRLIKNLVKNIPDNWVDRLLSIDKIRTLKNINYWVSCNELFRDIQKYVSITEYNQLIGVMLSEFNLLEPETIYNALLKNDENAFVGIMSKYQGNRKYQRFVAKCGALLLMRRFMFLKFSNPNIISEIIEIQQKIFEIKRNSGDTQILDIIDFLKNTKISEQEKVDYMKNDFFFGADLINKLNFQKMEEELPHHIGLNNKFDTISNYINSAAIEYAEDCQIIKPSGNIKIQKCPLSQEQLGELYKTLSNSGDIHEETSKEVFIKVFSGQEIENDERIVFTFKNQYSFKFLIQEMYKDGMKEVKEVPPQGIEVGKSSDIFFYIKKTTQKPLIYQRGGYSEESNNAKKERSRIKEMIFQIRQN